MKICRNDWVVFIVGSRTCPLASCFPRKRRRGKRVRLLWRERVRMLWRRVWLLWRRVWMLWRRVWMLWRRVRKLWPKRTRINYHRTVRWLTRVLQPCRKITPQCRRMKSVIIQTLRPLLENETIHTQQRAFSYLVMQIVSIVFIVKWWWATALLKWYYSILHFRWWPHYDLPSTTPWTTTDQPIRSFCILHIPNSPTSFHFL